VWTWKRCSSNGLFADEPIIQPFVVQPEVLRFAFEKIDHAAHLPEPLWQQ